MRKGLTCRAMFDIRTIVDDCRSVTAGGVSAGLMIWEMAVIPTLLNNAECWYDVSKSTVDELELLQTRFLKHLLAVGSGCPAPILMSETGTVLMELRILQKKLLFLHHLETLPSSALAKEVLELQRMFNWPGLIQECQPFLNKFHIQKVCQYSPYQWKRLVKTNILKLNKILIIERAEKQKYKKVNLDRLKEDDFDMKPYLSSMNVHDARMRFKLASKMFPTVQMNFQSDRKFMAELWSCAGCTAPGAGPSLGLGRVGRGLGPPSKGGHPQI